MPDSQQTAFIRLNLPPYSVAFRMRSRGSPSVVRVALRRALSPRRNVLRDLTGEFIATFAHHLVKLAGARVAEFALVSDPGDAFYSYVVYVAGKVPKIEYSEADFKSPAVHPLFKWLGMQYIRTKPSRDFIAKTTGRRGGRPSGLRKRGIKFEPFPGDAARPQPNVHTNKLVSKDMVSINERVFFDPNSGLRRFRIGFQGVERMRDLTRGQIKQIEADL